MKHDLTHSILSLSAIGALIISTPEIRAQPNAGSSSPEMAVPGPQPDLYLRSSGRFDRAGDLIGRTVLDMQGRELGKVRDVVFDLPNGRMPLALISTPNNEVAVPPALLTPRPGEKTLVLQVDKERLMAAPSVAENGPILDPSFVNSIYSYYRTPGYWQTATVAIAPEVREPAGAMRTPVWISGRDQDLEADQIFRQYQQGKMAARATDQRVAESMVATVYPQYPATALVQEPRSGMVNEGAGAQTPARLTKLTRTSDLLGMSVKTPQDQTLGQIRDVVIDWPSSRVAYAVVEPPDRGEKYIAVPPEALIRSTTDSKLLILRTNPEKLTSAPSFPKNNWPDPSNQAFLGEVYRFYGQPPYWQTGETK